MKKCPFCAEDIQDEAIKCKHCKEWIDDIKSIEASIVDSPEKSPVKEDIDKADENISSQDESKLKPKVPISNKQKRENKVQCPQCKKWDVFQTSVKDGDIGDYCPHCKQSLKSMEVVHKEQDDLPITYKVIGYDFRFLSSSFNWQDKEYPYESVTKLGFYRRKSSYFFIPVGDYVRVNIFIENKKTPITIDDKIGLVGTTKEILNLYTKLGEMTFLFRLQRYINELEEYGYFSYDKAKFYLDGKVTYGSLSFDIFDLKMWTQPFTLFMAKRSKIGLVVNPTKISTEINRDVLFYLLEKLYGLTFGN